MLSVKNRGIGIAQGGVDTSLMMMKTNPEPYVKVPLNPVVKDGYSNGAGENGSPVNVLKSNQPKVVTAKAFRCIEGYDIITT